MSLTRLLGGALLAAGLLLLATPLASNLIATWHQQQLLSTTDSPVILIDGGTARQAAPAPGSPHADSPSVTNPSPPPIPQSATSSAAGTQSVVPSPPPDNVMRLEIPTLKLKLAVLPDLTPRSLSQGPAHYPQTPLPGGGGNVAIAGHRTIKSLPSFFRRLDRLRPGDEIRLIHAGQIYHYQVERLWITTPLDIAVIGPTGYDSLTLTTCDPPGRSEMRLIVRAKLVPPSLQ